jgi:hypothetical protein
MNPVQIASFLMRWNPVQNTGQIVLTLANGQKKEISAAASEFAAIAAILNQSPIYLFPDGSIGTAWEPVEDK